MGFKSRRGGTAAAPVAIDRLEQRVDAVVQEMGALGERLERRIDTVDRKVDAVDRKVDAVEARLMKHIADVATHTATVVTETLQRDLARHSGAILDEVRRRFDLLEEKYEDLPPRVARLEGDVQTLREGFDGHVVDPKAHPP
jgi:chaperonin cofactor prefoldin